MVFIILFLSGCSNVSVNPDGIKDYFIYLGRKEIINFAKDDLEQRFDEDFSMRMKDYKLEKKQISKSSKTKKSYIIRGNNWEIDTKGNLRFSIKGKREYDTYEYGLFRTKKDRPLRFGFGFHQSGVAKLKIEIEDFRITAKTNLQGEAEFFINYSIKL